MPAPSRQERLTRFATFISARMAERGLDEMSVANEFDTSKDAVTGWTGGRNLPHISKLEQLSELLEVDLGVLCDLVGKPRIDALRTSFATDTRQSLPGLLRDWQDRNGLTALEAGNACRLGEGSDRPQTAQENWSRLVCGSSQPSPERILVLADGTGIALATLARAAWPGDDPRSADTRERTIALASPSARTLRRLITGPLDELVEASQIPAKRLRGFQSGHLVPSIDEVLTLSPLLDTPLEALLLACGQNAEDAARISGIVSAAQAHRALSPLEGGALVRDARLSTGNRWESQNRGVTGRSINEIASVSTISRFRVMDFENGKKTPEFAETCMLALVTGADLHQLVGAYHLVAA